MSSGFVSEGDLAERRRVRQEMWQSTRTENDPEEPPEEPAPDNRTLFERLQEQKDKKQEDWEEAHKLKNMVRGLEDDEVDFLEHVDNTKMREEKRIKAEEKSALQEYRKKVSAMQQKAVETEVRAELRTTTEGRKPAPRRASSQVSLLSAAIKRKRTDEGGDADAEAGGEESERRSASSPVEDRPPAAKKVPGMLQCVAVLPGLGVYTDSSDSDDSNSDSEPDGGLRAPIPRDITGRLIHLQASAPGAKGFC